MALKTIHDYTAIPVRAADDELLIYDVSTGITRKIAVDDLLGAIISGGATLVVSGASVINGQLLGGGAVDTNGNTLDVDSNSTINGSLDGEGFTLSVPATGVAALLGRQQSFTQQQTVAPTEAGDDGVILNIPSGSTNGVAWRAQFNGTSRAYLQVKSNLSQLTIPSWDNGSGVGPLVFLEHNNNGSTPAPGSVGYRNSGGTAYFVYPDASGNLRIHTSQPTNANQASGTVVGSQSSHIAFKDVLGDAIDAQQAATFVMKAAEQIKRFVYKDGSFGGQEFSGIVLDGPELHRYGMDADPEHPAGKALNIINIIGDLILTASLMVELLNVFVTTADKNVDILEKHVIRMAAIEKRLDDAGL